MRAEKTLAPPRSLFCRVMLLFYGEREAHAPPPRYERSEAARVDTALCRVFADTKALRAPRVTRPARSPCYQQREKRR
jgi:hypothetical protein